MPLHDWTRVDAGIFHSFHLSWIGEIVRVLNAGMLPRSYYALGEQVTTGGNLDVLALHETQHNGTHSAEEGNTALLSAQPATRLITRGLLTQYVALQRQIASVIKVATASSPSSKLCRRATRWPSTTGRVSSTR